MTTRRFDEDQIGIVLRRAAELQERSDRVGDGVGSLSLGELRQIAEEAGIQARFVDLAVASLDAAPDGRKESRLVGGAYEWHLHTSVEGELTDEDREQVVRAIRSAMGQRGEVSDLYGRMEWSHDDGLGPFVIGVSSKEGRTEVDVSAMRSSEATMVHLVGVPMTGLATGAVLVTTAGLAGPAGVAGVLGATAVSYVLARVGWRVRAGALERKLHDVLRRVTGVVAERAARTSGADDA